MPSRRTVLAAVAATATAGCVDRIPGFGKQGFRLGSFWVTNVTGEPQTIALVIERNGETVLDTVVDLDTDEKQMRKLDPTWSVEPASYTLSYGTPGSELSTYELTAEDDETDGSGCMFVHMSIRYTVDNPGIFVADADGHPWNPPCPDT